MDCVALGNLGIPGIPLESQGSEQPTSQVAGETGAYFESVFDAALGNATPTCYIEGTTDGNSGLWISYSVEGTIPANAADLIKNELVAKGIAEGNIRTLSTSIFGGQFSGVTVSGDPALGQYQESGVGLLITQQGIVLIAGVDVNAITP